MSKKPFFSVIISNKNAYKWLDKCFSSLKNQTYKSFEVIFIDNHSTDRSVELVEKKFSWVKVICNKADLGPGVAMNIATGKTQGEYLFLMNTDSYIDSDTLENLSAVLKKHSNYEIVELAMKNYEKTNIKEPAYKFGMDIFGYPMPSDKLFYADVCGAAIKRDLYLKLEGFDTKFYMYLDDLDFSWRARLLGKQIYLLNNIYIYHHTGGTSIPTSSYYHKAKTYTTTLQRRYHAQKNNLRTLIKNYSLLNVLWIVPASVVMASIEGILYLIKGNVKGFITLHKAILWNIVNLPDTLKERRKIQSQRIVSDLVIWQFCEKKLAKLHSLFSHGIPKTQ